MSLFLTALLPGRQPEIHLSFCLEKIFGKTWGENTWSVWRSKRQKSWGALWIVLPWPEGSNLFHKKPVICFLCPLPLYNQAWGCCFWWNMKGTQSYITQLFFLPVPCSFYVVRLLKYQITVICFLGWSKKGWKPYHSDGEILKHEVSLELWCHPHIHS